MSTSLPTGNPPSPQPPPLVGMSLTQLTDWVQQQNQPAYRGKQLHQWLYQKNVRSLSEITVFPKKWRHTLADYPIGRSKVEYRSIAPDQTRKYLLSLVDGLRVEAVGIPSQNRLTVCLSSQVGCAMACDFCATGKTGFQRNLQVSEMVDQVLTVQQDFQRRVSHVVFMGMGEPLLNLPAVVATIRCLNTDVGISQRSLTVSSVGLPGKIEQLAQHQLQITFALSLHAPNQQLREQLIPSARHYRLDQLLADCRHYVKATGRRVTFEYILLAGINDQPEHALGLAQKLKGFQAHVNLIPYNPIAEAAYRRPNHNQVQGFQSWLKQEQIAVSVRYSRGLEAEAACGQLTTNPIISPHTRATIPGA